MILDFVALMATSTYERAYPYVPGFCYFYKDAMESSLHFYLPCIIKSALCRYCIARTFPIYD